MVNSFSKHPINSMLEWDVNEISVLNYIGVSPIIVQFEDGLDVRRELRTFASATFNL